MGNSSEYIPAEALHRYFEGSGGCKSFFPHLYFGAAGTRQQVGLRENEESTTGLQKITKTARVP